MASLLKVRHESSLAFFQPSNTVPTEGSCPHHILFWTGLLHLCPVRSEGLSKLCFLPFPEFSAFSSLQGTNAADMIYTVFLTAGHSFYTPQIQPLFRRALHQHLTDCCEDGPSPNDVQNWQWTVVTDSDSWNQTQHSPCYCDTALDKDGGRAAAASKRTISCDCETWSVSVHVPSYLSAVNNSAALHVANCNHCLYFESQCIMHLQLPYKSCQRC